MGLIFKRIIALMAFVASYHCYTQSYHGFVDDNFNGVYGMASNPANVVDSRHRANINIFSANGLFSSDYTPANITEINLLNNGFNGIEFNADFQGIVSNNNTALANLDIMLPSFMFAINDKHAVGLLLRLRGFFNYNRFNGPLWEGLSRGFPDNVELDDFNNSNIDATTHYWGEIGVTYGTVLLDDQAHFLKVGATGKYVRGFGATQVSSNRLIGSYEDINGISNPNEVLNLSGDLTYLTAFVPEGGNNFGLDDQISSLTKESAPGVALDVGFVYEYRTRESRRPGIGKNARAVNKYKLKVAASLLDFGQVTYKNVLRNQYAINSGYEIATQVLNSNNGDLISVLDAESELEDRQVTRDQSSGKLKVALPTSIQVNVDYLLQRNIYVNLGFNTTIVDQSAIYNNNRLNITTITPRYEAKNYSAYLPLGISEAGGFAAGLGFRYGPLTVGSATLISSLLQDSKMNNFYAGLNIPILEDWDHAFYPASRKKHRKRRARKRFGRR